MGNINLRLTFVKIGMKKFKDSWECWLLRSYGHFHGPFCHRSIGPLPSCSSTTRAHSHKIAPNYFVVSWGINRSGMGQRDRE